MCVRACVRVCVCVSVFGMCVSVWVCECLCLCVYVREMVDSVPYIMKLSCYVQTELFIY